MSAVRTGSAVTRLLLVVSLLLVASPPESALGAGPGNGVHIDPGSPAAKEYSIPLGTARGNGTAGTNQLFGSGITRAPAPAPTPAPADGAAAPTPPPAASGAATVRARLAAHHHRRHRRAATRRGATATATPSAAPRPPTPQSVIGTGTSSTAGITWMLVAAVVVLALGALGAIVIGRRSRRASPSPS